MPPPIASIQIFINKNKRRKTMLTIQRPNAQRTGASLEVLPSMDGRAIRIILYPQIKSDELTIYDEPISTTLHYEDMSLILMVLLGYEENVLNGKGIYHQYANHTMRILFRHIIGPVAGYELEIIDTKKDSLETKMAKITLQIQDALALSYGIQGVLSSSLIGG